MDTLFEEQDDGTDTIRVEIRLKFNVGPFDTAGWSLDIRNGGKQVALEVHPEPNQSGYPEAIEWLTRDLVEKLHFALIPIEQARARARRNIAREVTITQGVK